MRRADVQCVACGVNCMDFVCVREHVNIRSQMQCNVEALLEGVYLMKTSKYDYANVGTSRIETLLGIISVNLFSILYLFFETKAHFIAAAAAAADDCIYV